MQKSAIVVSIYNLRRNIEMREIFFKIYFVLVTVLFFSFLFTILHEEVLCESIYMRHLPEPVVYPQYDIITGSVSNTSEVTFWSEWDHIPWYGIFSNHIAGFTISFGGILHLLFLILLIPIGIFNINKKLWVYWLILIAELVSCWFLISEFIVHYW